MAENETLDLMGRNSGRWRDLWRLIEKGARIEDIREKAARCLYTTYRKMYEDVPVGDLLRAACGEDGDVERLARDCRKHTDYVGLFRLEADAGCDRKEVARRVSFGIIDRFLDQIGMKMLLSRDIVRDLLRIAMAVYVVDRLCRRDRRSAKRGPKRHIDLTVEVSEPDFWRGEPVAVLRRACELLSDDRWDIRFAATPAQARSTQRCFDFGMPGSPVVCLYSGGLDSAAGLATQLRARRGKTLVVTADHEAGQQTRVLRHLSWLRARYGRELHPAIARTTLIAPPRPSKQELTQPCRSLLFAALGGAAACACEAAKVEVYENGVGVINLPLMTGMQVGGRSSRSCHPVFLRHMTSLLSLVAERTISFELPFRSRTKAEVVQALAEDGLGQLARDTVSCVHYPMREQGPAKQCGICAACIGRRQALIKAGVEEPSARYLHDIFGSQSALAAVPKDKLDFLLASLWQVDLLGELRPGKRPPDLVRRHLYGTGILNTGEPVEEWIDVLVRYREEWLQLIGAARSRGLSWGNWLSTGESAA